MLPWYVTVPIIFSMIAVLVSGIYWWIPKYVEADKQELATHWLLVSFSAGTLILNLVNSSVIGATGSSLGLATTLAGGKVRHR